MSRLKVTSLQKAQGGATLVNRKWLLDVLSLLDKKGKTKRDMASASYTEDLTCSICLKIFDDPVILPCGHSFCRECITLSLSSQPQCPQCRAAVATGGECLMTSHILKSLSEKEAERLRRKHGDGEVSLWLFIFAFGLISMQIILWC